jgi:hypothetical protein
MSLLSLPDECFNNILFFLSRNTLHKCLLVNRYFCKLSIPIIWRNPFKRPTRVNSPLLTNTLIKCLNEDEISSLIPYGIIINYQPSLFKYEKFIRRIDHRNFVISLLEWVKYKLVIPPTFDRDFIIQKLIDVLYHMFMRAESNLKDFVIFMDLGSYDLPNISTFTTYNPGITNLKTLKLEIINDSIRRQNSIELLSKISKVCNEINNFQIWADQSISKIMLPILDIIKLQPIKSIYIHYNSINNMGDISKFIIFTSKFRSETLKRLIFYRMSFKYIDFSLISKLKYLEYLEIYHGNDFTEKHCEDLSKKEFNLIGLTWLHNFTKNDTIHVIVMINLLCNGRLVELHSNVTTLETVNTIKKSCPNIRLLRVKILGTFWHSMIPLISELTSLKSPVVQVEIEVNNHSLLKFLGDSLSSIESLTFNFDSYSVNLPLYFEYFTSNCKANLKKLSIGLHNLYDNNLLRIHFLKCVSNYQRVHQSLKVLEIKQYDIHWSSEEEKIIKSLENQGICFKKLEDF